MNWKKLPLLNLFRRPARTAALGLLSAFLCFSILGGTLVMSGLNSGLASLEARLGADIMVVPYEAATRSALNDIILQGNPGYFYMDRSVLEKLSSVEGVGEMSEQFFLASSSSGCCSVAVQLIGFDPETDFTIAPWVKTTYRRKLEPGEILVGNDLNAFAGDTLTFYGTDCRVAGKLSRTGTYLDTAVYTSRDTIKKLIVSAMEKKLFNFGSVDPDEITSCVLINTQDGFNAEEVCGNINLHVRKVKAVRTQDMISDIAGKLEGTRGLVLVLMAAVWILALAVLALAFTLSSNERKKEFAILRVMGASRRQVSAALRRESFLLCLAGSLAGAFFALLILLSFGGSIENALGLPFLLPPVPGLALLVLAAVAVAVLSGSLAAGICAAHIARADAALILRGDN